MELLDRYLQAVRFWLPKTSRQDDLLAELGEDLRSQVEDKETELGRRLDKNEIAEILKRCGSPMMVAARLGPQRHLIGPALFPIYQFVLKMVLFWILVPVFIFIVGPVNLAQSGGNWGAAVLNTFGDLWSGLFIAAGTITLVFAIVERTSFHLQAECKWDPLKLPALRTPGPKPSPLKAACEFGFGFFGLIWLLLVPYYPVLILGPAAAFLKAGPLLHRFYLPILLLGVVGLLRSVIRLARPQWEWFPSLSQLANTVLTLDRVELHEQRGFCGSPHGKWRLVSVFSPCGKRAGLDAVCSHRRRRERVHTYQYGSGVAGPLHRCDRADLGIPALSPPTGLRRTTICAAARGLEFRLN